MNLIKYAIKQIGGAIHAPFLHPLLFAVFPILALWETNFSRMAAIEVLRPLLMALLAAILLFFLAKLIFRNGIKAGLLATFILLLYFSYGHIYGLIENKAIFGVLIGRHRILIAFWLLIFLAGSFVILRFAAKASGFTLFLNRAGLVLLVLSVGQLAFLQIRTNNLASQRVRLLSSTTTGLKSSPNSPDVYLIVLDAYMRGDVIQRTFNYDNKPFLNELTGLGFNIPSCAQSNYTWTALSISSLLNMNYIDQFAGSIDPKSPEIDYASFTDYISHSQVREQFHQMGYHVVSFEVGYPWVQISDADIYIKKYRSSEMLAEFLNSSDFDQMLSETTLFRIADDAQTISPVFASRLNQMNRLFSNYTKRLTSNVRSVDQKWYDGIMNGLDSIVDVARMPGKKFVYLHVPAPHPPFVVDSNGSFSPTTDPQIGYPAAVEYVDRRVLSIIQSILNQSKYPPVIILQGDHGWGDTADTRMFILNAYYLPGASKQIYPTITPINTFRMIFNTYFSGNYTLLPDHSYFSADRHYFDFKTVPPTCPK